MSTPRFSEELQGITLGALKSPCPNIAARYAVQPSFRSFSGVRLEIGREFFFDDKHALVLFYEHDGHPAIPLACASFRIRGSRPSMIVPPFLANITQIQGRNHRECKDGRTIRSAASRIDWEALLVRAVLLIARHSDGIREVWIRFACHNEYFEPMECDRNNRLVARYDANATRLGFERRPYAFVHRIDQ